MLGSHDAEGTGLFLCSRPCRPLNLRYAFRLAGESYVPHVKPFFLFLSRRNTIPGREMAMQFHSPFSRPSFFRFVSTMISCPERERQMEYQRYTRGGNQKRELPLLVSCRPLSAPVRLIFPCLQPIRKNRLARSIKRQRHRPRVLDRSLPHISILEC